MTIKQLYTDNNLNIQEAEYTCGPVTLLNVLRLKGNSSHTEEELAKKCKSGPEHGTLNKDLVRVAKEIGIEVIEAKEGGTIADIEHHLDNGAYVIVCYQHLYADDGHYSVITEHDDVSFYFRDCSYGFFRLKKKYLPKAWYGSSGSQQWYAAVK